MSCFIAGTLGFTIVPDEATANYNWQLFDITSTNPNDIFTNPNLFVACNWSSEPGETGASSIGNDLVVCSGSGQPLFSKMPDLQTGHTYLLMVVNQSSSPDGYQLSFTGGTASITDAVEPHLQQARVSCNGNSIIVRLNKQMKCSSLAPDGSDFIISGGATITAATPGDCSSPFGTDSIILSLSQSLSNGIYTLSIINGTDGNTLIDVCNRTIPIGESLSLTVAPIQPTLPDSVTAVACSPRQLELVFQKPIRCNSIATNGSDFVITGPQTVTISNVTTNCNNSFTTSVIRLQLSSPIATGGIYQVQLTTGSDGNTIIDECGLATPAGSSVSFTAGDTVSADFTYAIAPSCKENTVSFLPNSNSNITNWEWDFGNGRSSTLSSPVITYITTGQHTVRLIVSNSTCSDTSFQPISLSNQLIAAFEAPAIICPGDPLTLLNKSTGAIDYWQWSFGNGSSSSDEMPAPQFFLAGNAERFYTIQLIAGSNAMNCRDTAWQTVRVPVNCRIAVPSAFTPNNDGKNDFLYPVNAYKALDLDFKVFNRFGQLLFSTKNASGKWDGRVNGVEQNTGVYIWTLSFIHSDTGQRVFMKGATTLIR